MAVKKNAAQTPIAAVLSAVPAIVAGGEMGNVPYLNQRKCHHQYLNHLRLSKG